MRTLTSILVATLLMATGGAATAATFVVPGDYDTIQAAVDAAESGDTIVVKKGKYEGDIAIGTSGITLLGKGKPVLIEGDSGLSLTSVSGVLIQGFSIQDMDTAAIFLEDCEDVTITKCTIEGSDEDGIRAEDCVGLTISKNKFQNIATEGVALSDDTSGEGSSECVVEKNKFKNIGDDAIDISGDDNEVIKNKISGTGGGGIDLDDGTGNLIEKNKMKKIRGDGIETDAENTTIVKNKVSKPGDDGIHVGTTGNYLEKNAISKAGDDGIDLNAGGNTLVQNKMSKCGGYDLEVDADVDPETNTYEGNRYRTRNW